MVSRGARRIGIRGGERPLRRGGRPRPPACWTWVQVTDDRWSSLRGMWVCSVGADALGGPLVGHAPRSAGRRGRRPLRRTRGYGLSLKGLCALRTRANALGNAPSPCRTSSVSGTPSAPVCALGHTQGPRRGRQGRPCVGAGITRPLGGHTPMSAGG